MVRRTATPRDAADVVERIVDIDVAAEMEGSFLEYAYSVIYSRALPDARDGLKPVHRRILFQMAEMGLRPDRPHVKSSRVVGDVMGKLHPHGDSAIYDAMVRLAQPFSLRLPLVDGHGNFGSLDDGPAAPRYTEARMSPAAEAMTKDLGEGVVNYVPNYDNKLTQPEVLPSAIPNLLVNGGTGIAVGMATNMAPHNLVEVIAAARHLIANPNASLDDLIQFVPGPDLPTGGKIIGLDGVREAYRSGRGIFRTRATATIENLTARKQGIVVTELPYGVGPEKVIEKIKDGVQSKKLTGISDTIDLTDRENGLRLVIEVKTGFRPEAVLDQLYCHTPLEDSFGINNVALVDGQPRTLGLRELLQVWVDHRIDVTRRRCEYRLAKRQERLHLVEGLLVAILDIDKVISIIRASSDSEDARTRLCKQFKLSEVQTDYILELRLRRLTKFSKIELDNERKELLKEIKELTALLASDKKLRGLVSDEMAEVATAYGTPRRTVLLEASAVPVPTAKTAAAALQIEDTPSWALLSSTGRIARTANGDAPIRPEGAKRARHDVVTSAVLTTARGEVGVFTSQGRMLRVSALDLPTLAPTNGAPNLAGGTSITEVVTLDKGERVIALASLAADAPEFAIATAQGIIKRVVAGDVPTNGDAWVAIGLKDGDEAIGAAPAADTDEIALISSDSSLLHFPATAVRPQGRAAGGMAGIKLADGQKVVAFGVIPPNTAAVVATVAGTSAALPLAQAGAGKVTPFEVYPGKGRATGGVRTQRFLKGEDTLIHAYVGAAPAWATAANGVAVSLPALDQRRDASGTPLSAPIHGIG